MPRLLIAIVLGVALGIAGARFVALGFWTLFPWGVAGLLTGLQRDRARAALAGALYGFSLTVTFMIGGYTGKASLMSRVPFFVLLGLFGGACGALLGVVGFMLRARVGHSRASVTER